MTRTKSSRALLSVVLAVLMAAAFMPSLTYSSFAATAKKATKVTKVTHADKAKFTRTVGTAWTLKYKLSPSKLTSAAKKVVWKSSNSKVAKITTIKSGKAVVSFKSVGKASVTVYTKANKKARTTWNFKVVEKTKKTPSTPQTALTGITVSKDGAALTDTTAVKAGDTLKATVAPANGTATYQWYADDKAIDGATADTYTVTNEVAGKTISVKATGVGSFKGTVESAKSAKATAVALTGVTIQKQDPSTTTAKLIDADSASVGDTLTATVAPKELTNVVSYQWYHLKNGKFDGAIPISGATSKTYTLTDNDAYEGIGVQVTSKEADGKTVVKEDILGTMTTTVNANKSVKVELSKDGKTAAKDGVAAKVGDTLTALVTPSKAADQVEYQWYQKTTTTVLTPVAEKTDDNGNQYYTAKKVTKWTALTGETKSTYTPSKAGEYGVEIRLSAAGQRAGYTIVDTANEVHSFDSMSVSAKDFTGVSPYIYDARTVDGNADQSKSGDVQNATTSPFALIVPGLVYGKDYTVAWKVDRTKDGTTTTYTVVDGSGKAKTAATVNYDPATGANKGTIRMSNDTQKNIVAEAGDKLYAVITGADGSVYAGQTAESNKITLTNGKIADNYTLKAKDDNTLVNNAEQYTATLSAKTGTLEGVSVAWYYTTEYATAAQFKDSHDVTDAKIAGLKSLNAPANLTSYTGNLNEGGSYVIAVVTKAGSNGKLAYAAVKNDNPSQLFQSEINKSSK